MAVLWNQLYLVKNKKTDKFIAVYYKNAPTWDMGYRSQRHTFKYDSNRSGGALSKYLVRARYI